MSHTYTWDKLAKNATRLNPSSRGKNYPYTPKFERILILPFVGTKSCLVKLQAWGVTENGLHQVTLLFGDCDIQVGEQELSLWHYFKVEYQNQIYYVKKFDQFRNPLTARCTCNDFIYTWAWYNYYNAHCLYGPAPRPYRKKTARPPRNPRGIPGICLVVPTK